MLTDSDHRMLRSKILIDLQKETGILKKLRMVDKKLFNAEIFVAKLASADLGFHSEKGVNCDYEGFVKQITGNIRLASEAAYQQDKCIKEDTIQMM